MTNIISNNPSLEIFDSLQFLSEKSVYVDRSKGHLKNFCDHLEEILTAQVPLDDKDLLIEEFISKSSYFK